MLALHGFPDVASTFDGLIEALVSAGFHVVAPQMRGYAPSVLDVPTSRTLFDTLAKDAIAIADSLAPGKNFSVVGHDNGAFATYSLLRLAGPRAVCAVTLRLDIRRRCLPTRANCRGRCGGAATRCFFRCPAYPTGGRAARTSPIWRRSGVAGPCRVEAAVGASQRGKAHHGGELAGALAPLSSDAIRGQRDTPFTTRSLPDRQSGWLRYAGGRRRSGALFYRTLPIRDGAWL